MGNSRGMSLTERLSDRDNLRQQLALKRQEHQDLDQAIEALMAMSTLDQLQVRRLKKKKLFLKDQIKALEDQLFPDIIA